MSAGRESEVVRLLPTPTPDPPLPEMIASIEKLLDRAKAGEFASVLLVWERRDAGSGYHVTHEAGARPAILIGETSIASAAMSTRWRE